jgi:predicted dehydrogenase
MVVAVATRRPISVGLIGLGAIAVRGHLPAIAGDPRAELVAVCDVDPARLAAHAPPGVRPYTDPEAFFAGEELDAVVVATPPDVTAALATRALETGAYVLAEKPLGLSTADARAVARSPGAHDRLQIGLTYRHHPAIERLRDAIAAGDLGRPLFIQNTIADEPAEPGDAEAHARRRRSLERNPPVVSDGVHACDRLNLLLGASPVSVIGWAHRSDPAYASPNVNGGVLTYEDGTLARVEVVWMYPVLPPSQLVVTGPKGSATIEPPTFALHLELDDGRTERLDAPGDKTTVCFALQLERFVDHCLSGTAPEPGIDAAIASVELAERIAVAGGALARGPVAGSAR